MAKEKAPEQLTKREKFDKAGRFPVVKAAIIGLVVVVIAVGAFVGYRVATSTPEVGGQVVEQSGPDYGADPVSMIILPNVTVADGNLEIPVEEIKANKIVGLLYHRTNPMPAGYDDIGENGLPVLAYVAPSGRLVVATSLCEPCHSYDFHIEGTDLVCNACFTHWDLNTLEGIEGGCQAYPPGELTVAVQGDTVRVPTAVLESWVPRT